MRLVFCCIKLYIHSFCYNLLRAYCFLWALLTDFYIFNWINVKILLFVYCRYGVLSSLHTDTGHAKCLLYVCSFLRMIYCELVTNMYDVFESMTNYWFRMISSWELIRCKPTFPCKLWKFQSGSLDQHPRGIGDWVILQSGPVLGLGNHTFANPPSHLSAPLSLDSPWCWSDGPD